MLLSVRASVFSAREGACTRFADQELCDTGLIVVSSPIFIGWPRRDFVLRLTYGPDIVLPDIVLRASLGVH